MNPALLLIGLGIILAGVGSQLMFKTLLRGAREELRAWKLRRWKPAPVQNVYRVVPSNAEDR